MFNRKYFFVFVFIGLLAEFLIVAFFVSNWFLEKERKNLGENKIVEIRIGKNIFQAETAITPAEKSQGLSSRKELCENCAMLFLFEKRGWHSFWMKKMNFDLDMIWIDKNKIVYMVKNVSKKKEFEVINSEYKADKILEINAGLADKLGIKLGDKVEF